MKDSHKKELEGICYSIAKNLKWQMKPIDSTEIEALSKELCGYALSHGLVLKEYGHDIEVIINALSYIDQTGDGPWFGDDQAAIMWFQTKLDTLLEIAVFEPKITGKGELFIQYIRSKYA